MNLQEVNSSIFTRSKCPCYFCLGKRHVCEPKVPSFPPHEPNHTVFKRSNPKICFKPGRDLYSQGVYALVTSVLVGNALDPQLPPSSPHPLNHTIFERCNPQISVKPGRDFYLQGVNALVTCVKVRYISMTLTAPPFSSTQSLKENLKEI